jgi:hypothetical protein
MKNTDRQARLIKKGTVPPSEVRKVNKPLAAPLAAPLAEIVRLKLEVQERTTVRSAREARLKAREVLGL